MFFDTHTLASIITAVAIAYTGIIGFIGMIVPQLIRRYYWRFTLGIQMILNILIGATMMFDYRLDWKCIEFISANTS